ncbi:hypothetical protein TSUD_364620 [Trifolium subterraneum]|uniref:RNase H type-1 domain-containing protein n=1 Tax=Trifolium subterraneum TaxID=3900 RepID=A0A2Z6MCI5_TRISU|nr:hypothetical protein TSUD_364620 [Trifolium subterraneum]
MAFTKTIEGHPEIREAEAVAMLETLKWLQHYRMQRFHIEIDCIQVVQGIEGKNRNNMEFGNVTGEIVHDETSNNNFILQLVDNAISKALKSKQKNTTLNDVSSCAIPETTLKVVIVSDDDFDEVVKADIQMLKQV